MIRRGILVSGRRAIAIAIPLLAAWVPPCDATTSRLEAEIERQVERAVEGRLGFPGGLIVVQRESGELPAGGPTASRSSCAGASSSSRSEPALVAPLGAGTQERNRLDEARGLHSEALDPIRSDLELRGCELGRIDGLQQPSLAHGRQESFPVEIPRAGKVLVAASCDYGCADLDLALEDPGGKEIARDQEIDPEPRLWVEVPSAGTYRLTVRMEHCRDGPCAYIASLLAPRPPPPGGRGDQGGCSPDAQDLVAAVEPLDTEARAQLAAEVHAAALGRRAFTPGLAAPGVGARRANLKTGKHPVETRQRDASHTPRPILPGVVVQTEA